LFRRDADIGHVDLLVSDHRANIAHQPFAVKGHDHHRHRIGTGALLGAPPVHHDQPVRLSGIEHVLAVATVHGDAPPTGDITDDRVAGCRVAAPRQVDQQAAPGSLNFHAIRGIQRDILVGVLQHLEWLGGVEPLVNLVAGNIAIANRRKQVFGPLEAKQRRNLLVAHIRPPQQPQLTIQRLTPDAALRLQDARSDLPTVDIPMSDCRQQIVGAHLE